ncbi:MAG: response regulator [Synergistaceae bacterium]|nr:response regulator [Synergistaceae bacterium]
MKNRPESRSGSRAKNDTENERPKIILVDDNTTNLALGEKILNSFYEVRAVPSAEKLFECLEHGTPDLILLDLEMPEIDGCQAIKYLKNAAAFSDIPVIFLTAEDTEDVELEWFNMGAIDCVSKPFSPSALRKCIETHLLLASQKKELRTRNEKLQALVLEKSKQVSALQNAVLGVMSGLVECRDCVAAGHASRTRKYLQFMIEKLIEENLYTQETSGWDLDYLLPSAQLHDVGKIAISDAILNKPGKLTHEEFEKMKEHVTFGVNAIECVEAITAGHDFLRHAKVFASTHHEKWDGSGYPWGLSEGSIPLEGRLMAVVDVYDALTSQRPYKNPFPPSEAEEIITSSSGTHFDPVLVDVFHKVNDHFAEVANAAQCSASPGTSGIHWSVC